MQTKNLSKEQKNLVIAILNAEKEPQHPMATEENLQYFTDDHVKESLGKAKPQLQGNYAVMADDIITILGGENQ